MRNKSVIRQLYLERLFRSLWLGFGTILYWVLVAHISFLNATQVTIALTDLYSIGVLMTFFLWAFFGVAVLYKFASLRPI